MLPVDTSKFLHPRGCEFTDELAGEYEFPVEFTSPPTILDIGACCGAFAVWAAHRWPMAKLICYEPIPSNYEYLLKNMAVFGLKAHLYNLAVIELECPGTQRFMYEAGPNCGTYSFFDLGEQDTRHRVTVYTIPPYKLPPADILKLDTEGCELIILEHMTTMPNIVMLEWHRASDFLDIKDFMDSKGFSLVKSKVKGTERGVMKFRRSP